MIFGINLDKYRMFHFLFVIMIFNACATKTEKAKNIREITSKDQATGCLQVGMVNSSSKGGGFGGSMYGNHDANVNLYNLAAEQGDTILFVKNEHGLLGVDYQAIVYRCNK